MNKSKQVVTSVIRMGTIVSASMGICLTGSIVDAATPEPSNVISIYTDGNPKNRPTHIDVTIGDGTGQAVSETANTIHIAIGEVKTKEPTIIKIYVGASNDNEQYVVQSNTSPNVIVRSPSTEQEQIQQKTVLSALQTTAENKQTVDTVHQRKQSDKVVNDMISRRVDISKVNASQGVQHTSLDTLHMLERFNQPAPKWTYTFFELLDKEGLLLPDKEMHMHSLSRREGAILTARAYNTYHAHHTAHAVANGAEENKVLSSTLPCIMQLMEEFAPEVEALGYGVMPQLTDTQVQTAYDKDLQIHGEIRYSYANHEGSPTYTWIDNRMRARIYLDKKIIDHWTAHAMAEYDKSHISHITSKSRTVRSSHDGKARFSRYYVEGSYTWWNIPFTIEAGKTYAYLADGNVLDSDFHGLKVTAKPDVNTSLSAGIGNVNDTEHMQFLEAWLRQKRWDYMMGWYHWNNYDNPTTIMAGGGSYNIGNYRFTGMYLNSDTEDGSGATDGYVASVRFGRNFSWIAHTYEFDLNYYHMAGHTYINHTMNGLGNYMNGFTGWGAMFYYTLYENVMCSLQYYDLQDKTTHEKSRTLWAELNWGF